MVLTRQMEVAELGWCSVMLNSNSFGMIVSMKSVMNKRSWQSFGHA